MKILIVDDQPRKYARLTEKMGSLGVSREDVVIVTCTEAALSRLEETLFDLLVLDVLVPLREEGDPGLEHSVDLLTEISESSSILRPGRIVGITADPAAATAASPIFKEKLWTIVPYVENNDEWLEQISSCAIYIREAESNRPRPDFGVDVAVICALSDPELSQILALPWSFGAAKPVDESIFVHEGTFVSNSRTMTVVATSCPRMGLVSAALTTSRVIRAVRPRLVVMTGICAGVQGKVGMGDVIFVDPAWDWQSGKYLREADDKAKFLISPHQVGPTPSSRSFAEQLRQDKDLFYQIAAGAPDEAPGVLKMVVGPVASGAAVVADGEVTSEIKLQHRDTAGIEMECYGFFTAAESASEPRPIPIAMKSVCDFADSLKNDKYQRYAAYTSARAMSAYLERYGSQLIAR